MCEGRSAHCEEPSDGSSRVKISSAAGARVLCSEGMADSSAADGPLHTVGLQVEESAPYRDVCGTCESDERD